MVILDVDVGNTRLKWRMTTGTSLLGRGSELVSVCGKCDWLSAVVNESGHQPERVRVSSVRDSVFNLDLRNEVRNKWQIDAEFAGVTRVCAGITNSYMDVSRMGVDRWMSVLAAFQNVGRSCCVIDAGSALTVDIVDESGFHLGGYIVPGLSLMLVSLQNKSSALQGAGLPKWGSVEPGSTTTAAMENGILGMVCGWLGSLQTRYPEAEWVVTGGDASVLLPLLHWTVSHQPDLVLDGLSLSLP